MVTRHDVKGTGGQANFGWKYMFFQLLSTTKVNLVAKIMQSAYLCVIFHVKHKKLLFLAVLTWFLILGKIQDGDHCWWRHRPPAAPPPIKYTSFVKKIKGFPLKVRSFQNTATHQKLRGGIPSPPPVPCGGMNLLVRPRGNSCQTKNYASLKLLEVIRVKVFAIYLFVA